MKKIKSFCCGKALILETTGYYWLLRCEVCGNVDIFAAEELFCVLKNWTCEEKKHGDNQTGLQSSEESS